jgi:hypothetical protein
MPATKTYVWVFNGGGKFPSGVFSSRENAEAWIALHGLAGCLTKYPLDQGAYEWAIEIGTFTPRRDEQRTAAFIGRFACGQDHCPFESGKVAGVGTGAGMADSSSPEGA